MATPLLVGVAEIGRRPGSRLEVRRQVPAATLGELRVMDSEVPSDGVVDADLVLESIPDAVVATGRIVAPFTSTCRRCLGRIEGTIEQEVREVFERHPTEGETYELGHDHVDLEPMVREVVVLALPGAPLCSDDCRGPVPEVFEGGVFEDGEPEPEPDPRWSALDELRFDQ